MDDKACVNFCESNKMDGHEYAYCYRNDKCQLLYVDNSAVTPQISTQVSQFVLPCGKSTCNGTWIEGYTLTKQNNAEVTDPSEDPSQEDCRRFCKTKATDESHNLCIWTSPGQGLSATCRLDNFATIPVVTPTPGSVDDYRISTCKANPNPKPPNPEKNQIAPIVAGVVISIIIVIFIIIVIISKQD